MQPTIGYRALELVDEIQGAAIPLALFYPAEGEARRVRFGPYRLDLAPDAPAAAEELPLVALSHGSGGAPWVYRDLICGLVRAGYVVAAPEHIGNSRTDNSLVNTAANLLNRPRHIRRALDAAEADPITGPMLRSGPVAVTGHSIGACTALSLVGGRPWVGPREKPGETPHPLEIEPDPRIGALALLAPSAFWYRPPESLRAVRLPILIRTGEKDDVTPIEHADLIKAGVGDPSLIEHEIAPGAGHFSFMSPFPSLLVGPDKPASQDPEGFDRAAYAPVLTSEIIEFLRRRLD